MCLCNLCTDNMNPNALFGEKKWKRVILENQNVQGQSHHSLQVSFCLFLRSKLGGSKKAVREDEWDGLQHAAEPAAERAR